MDMGSIVPFGRGRNLPASRPANDPFVSLWRDVESLFDSFLRDFGVARPGMISGIALPLEVRETATDYVVTAELPGVDEKDVEITLTNDVLTIKGEKKVDQEHHGDNVYMAERSYGAFSRTLRLPYAVDPEKVEATFKNGVLTVKLPKPAEAVRSTRKIEVKAA